MSDKIKKALKTLLNDDEAEKKFKNDDYALLCEVYDTESLGLEYVKWTTNYLYEVDSPDYDFEWIGLKCEAEGWVVFDGFAINPDTIDAQNKIELIIN
ncbi:MAG: hypothetical protein ACTSUM_04110 [Alphaproteobacteria bacterium]